MSEGKGHSLHREVVVKRLREIVGSLVSGDVHVLCELVTGTTGGVLCLLAYDTRTAHHIGGLRDADELAHPTGHTAQGNASVDGLGVRNGHCSIGCGENDGLACSHTVDGVTAAHLVSSITPLMAEKTRGRATVTVWVATGLLPGMLRYIVLWD